jgi:hypothetical protein
MVFNFTTDYCRNAIANSSTAPTTQVLPIGLPIGLMATGFALLGAGLLVRRK